MNDNIFKDFTHQYPISKTLRFELKPYKETADRLEQFKSSYLREVVVEDEQRSKEYKQLKSIIDDYHREFIDKALASLQDSDCLTTEDISSAFEVYTKFLAEKKDNKKNDTKKNDLQKEWQAIQKELGKKLSTVFGKEQDMGGIPITKEILFKKDLIKENLKLWIESKDDSFFNNTQRPKQYTKSEAYTLIEHFKTWWTYFVGFNENRRNVYKNENKATSIINRTIYENLPKFFANISNYKNITKKFEIDFSEIEHHHKISLSEVFSPGYFLHTITQSGIDHYNSILGSVVAEDGSSIQGVNIVLNLFSQQQAKNDGTKIPRMATLFKQIMGEKEKKSFVIDGFNNDKELLSELSDSIHNILEHKNDNDKTLIEEIVELFSNFNTYDLTGIYIRKDERFSHLSRQISRTWNLFDEALEEYYINNKKTTDKKEKFVSVDTLIRALEEKEKTLDFENKDQQSYKEKFISHFKNMHIYNKEIEEIEYVCSVLDTSVNAVKPILGLEEFDKDRQIPKKEGEVGGEGFEQIQKIKKLLDTLMHILHLMKTFSLEKIENGEKIQVAQKNEDIAFYSQFNDLYKQLQDNLVGLYNKVRNYVTKKPYTLEKFKINFEKNTLLDGWDVNKEKANLGVLLCKDNQYYLGIMNRKHNKIFEAPPMANNGEEAFQKVYYKLLPGASKMLPKVFFF